MILDEWAAKWGVPYDALVDLRARVGITFVEAVARGKAGESRQQSIVRLEAAQKGIWLTRNNVGALMDSRGIPVRYGLANESRAQNEVVKSGDLIGIRPIVIQPRHLGATIGQFVSREMKHEGWTYRGDKHERAQLAWINFVIGKGGDAAFATGPGSFNYEDDT